MRGIGDHAARGRDGGRKICSGYNIALFSIALLLGACGQQTEAERVSQACSGDPYKAYEMTKRFVAGTLGNKQTAAFPYLSEVRARKPDPDDPCAWLIYGYVNLTARSGAEEQRPYVMNITYSGDNQWRATNFRWQTLGDSQNAATAQ